MNRGYVLNDLRMASRAEKDFQKAIQLRPDYGEAHLGLAYSYLQLRRAKPALREAEAAGKILGDSRPLHLAKAEAYRQQVMLAKAVTEYQSALKYQADDMLAPDTVHQRFRFYCGLSPNMAQCCWYQTDFVTLSRYARNIVRYMFQDRDYFVRRALRGREAQIAVSDSRDV